MTSAGGSTRLARVLSFFFSALACGASAIVYLEVSWFGFPDGHVTELEHAYARLSRYLLPPAVMLGLYLAYLGTTAGRRNIDRRLRASLLILAILAIWALIVCGSLRGRLDDGVGG